MNTGIGSIAVLESNPEPHRQVLARLEDVGGLRPVRTGIRPPKAGTLFHHDIDQPLKSILEETEIVVGNALILSPALSALCQNLGITVFPYLADNQVMPDVWGNEGKSVVEQIHPSDQAFLPDPYASLEAAMAAILDLTRARFFSCPEGPFKMAGPDSMLFKHDSLPRPPEYNEREAADLYGFGAIEDGPITAYVVRKFVLEASRRGHWVGVSKSHIQAFGQYSEGRNIDYWGILSKLAYEHLIAVEWQQEPYLFPTIELLNRRENQ